MYRTLKGDGFRTKETGGGEGRAIIQGYHLSRHKKKIIVEAKRIIVFAIKLLLAKKSFEEQNIIFLAQNNLFSHVNSFYTKTSFNMSHEYLLSNTKYCD